MSTLNWYVVRSVAGQEKKVKSHLEMEVSRQGFQEYIPQILIPTEKVYELRNGKKKVREKSFFPGYILIYADLDYGEVMHTITSVPGVIGFLQEDGREDGREKLKGTKKGIYTKKPTPLRESEVNRILGKIDEHEHDGKIDTPFIVGEKVKVMDGYFSGFDGVVEEVFEDRKKLNVIVKIFGRNTPMELSYMQVEKID